MAVRTSTHQCLKAKGVVLVGLSQEVFLDSNELEAAMYNQYRFVIYAVK